ncbi:MULTISPECIES: serine/threonine-protein kinase [Streptomyces]|uniref:non-specific serine/threonine protein kinase n=1 Tax=Streptomyces luteosporeus TaxID=173856 RepID=A0ABN3U610_9ACTN
MSARAGPRPAPLPAGALVAPGYEVLAHLHRTGWLDLYDAWSRERECRCVVKVLRPDRDADPELRERLLREGRWLKDFTHPHLVRAYEVAGAADPRPYVVLETLTGETLDHLVQYADALPDAGDLALLGVQLCSAVHYLHGQGLLHLDIKPDNVVIDCRRAKLLDLSTAAPPGPGEPGIGTRCYLSPEQARGGPLTAATDVWGIGVTLYEAATATVPFDEGEEPQEETSDEPPGEDEPDEDAWGEEELAARYPQLRGRAPSVAARRRLPAGLAAAIDACLRPDPAARPPLDALAAALDALLPQGRRTAAPRE